MKKLRIILIISILFLGINGIAGGLLLMTDPSGGKIKLPIHWIHNTPLRDYFIPGLILMLVNGIFSLLVASLVIFRIKNYEWFIFMQGILTFGWIIIQIIMIQLIFWLHFVIGGIALFLAISGIILIRTHLA